MSEYAADRRAHRVENTKWSVRNLGHRQNQRSPTTIVSPGRIIVFGGTVA